MSETSSGENSTGKDWTLIKYLASYFGLFVWLNSVYGVAVQKGMLNSMLLGNMSGNYSPQEIFYFSVIGINIMLEPLTTEMITKDAHIILITSLLLSIPSALIITYLCRNPKNRASISRSLGIRKRWVLRKLKRGYRVYIVTTAISILSSLSILVLAFIGRFIILLTLVSFLIPAYMGYLSGQKYVENLRNERECTHENDVSDEKLMMHQCAHLTINKKTVLGRVLLETSEGYFFHINSAFLFVTKDGAKCIYSISRVNKKYVESNERKETKEQKERRKIAESDAKFAEQSINYLCGTSEKT